MAKRHPPLMRALYAGAALITLGALTGCDNFDFDIRDKFGNAPDTSSAARQATSPRPQADNRGVISYPNYQVAIARRGDTVTDVATRVGLGASELSNYNGIAPDAKLRQGEIIALPRRVAEPSPATGSATTGPLLPEAIDITTLAGGAIERSGITPAAAPNTPTGAEPVRHKVERGETAYSISRLYNVSVRSLAEWNGLGANLSVREGQYLLIPVASAARTASASSTTQPGSGTPTPVPPSSTKPLPAETATTTTPAPASPNLSGQSTAAASNARLLYPVQGNIIRAYSSKSDGIDIAAKAGSPVKAADAGTVMLITLNTAKEPILIIRHGEIGDENLLVTVYAKIDAISVKKGDRVNRGQTIAKVRAANPSFVHFEVRKDFDSIDPMPYLE
ncbi:MAG: LysM peptidoglycan-binding domain-containing M23 family metallopeptidase [Marinosulfonomonas sp.]|nr:LysM peptidoglycan-binding domain-containing M23 family metallopeptidase [Marinosulfonomonas sp.]